MDVIGGGMLGHEGFPFALNRVAVRRRLARAGGRALMLALRLGAYLANSE
jgi:hypothetical protein